MNSAQDRITERDITEVPEKGVTSKKRTPFSGTAHKEGMAHVCNFAKDLDHKFTLRNYLHFETEKFAKDSGTGNAKVIQ